MSGSFKENKEMRGGWTKPLYLKHNVYKNECIANPVNYWFLKFDFEALSFLTTAIVFALYQFYNLIFIYMGL